MKKISLYLIVCIFASINCHSTPLAEKLYYIGGNPTSDGLKRFPTILYKTASTGELERVRAITTQKQGANFILPYYDQKLILIGNHSQTGFYQYDIIDMTKPNIEKSIEIKLCNSCNFGRSYILDKTKNTYLLIQATQELAKGKFVNQFLGYDLKTETLYPLNETDISFAQAFGASSGQFNHDHIEWLRNKNGRPMFYGAKENFLPWNFPNNLKLENKALLEQAVNNKKMRVITPHDLISSTPQNGQTLTHFAQDKVNGLWHKVELVNTTWVRGFGYWITTEQQTLGFTKERELNKLHKSGQNTDVSFKHYLERFQQWDIDKTGVLHIINPIANIHIRLNTNHPDSEVLLIEKDIVIYRVADKIYQAKIQGEQLIEHQLLVQNDAVQAIHWAFFGGS